MIAVTLGEIDVRRTETDEIFVTANAKGNKWGAMLGIPLAIAFGIAKCSGVDFRSDAQKLCESKDGIWQAPRGAVAVCIKKDNVISLESESKKASHL